MQQTTYCKLHIRAITRYHYIILFCNRDLYQIFILH
nr:MAG TPA: hypothetical protein [Caudoviricetes sp.]